VTDWLSRYGFTAAVALVALAVAAFRLTRQRSRPVVSAELYGSRSLAISVLLALVPASLALAAAHQSHAASHVLQGIALLVVAAMFFAATRLSKHVALFALICWLSTSELRPTRSVWTSVFGFVFLGCAVAFFATVSGA